MAAGGDVLRSIMAERRQDVVEAQRRQPLEALRGLARRRRHHSLIDRLGHHGPGPAIIAEMKRASPSAGILVADYDPVAIARAYAGAGAVALSVLTEPRHFGGSLEHLAAVRVAVDLPLLRKDFICEGYQLAEAAAWGADIVLLIAGALDMATMRELYRQAVEEFGLEVLVEAHTAEELDAALALGSAMVGVNSRNLRTLRTDLAVAHALASQIPADRLAIAESGIRTRADIDALTAAGYKGFLIGESLLRGGDPATALAALVGAVA